MTEMDAILRILVSLLLGLAIGIERELAHHDAGIRTFTLVTLGSTLAMLMSIYVCESNTNLLNGDPGRIAAQVVTGIGFIGAGVIMKKDNSINGLTTAACIFISAIIGLAVGSGMILLPSVVTVIILLVLIIPRIIRKKLGNYNKDND